jgi:hypothetical protein
MRFTAAAAFLATALAASAQGPVAFVADIHGNATIEGNGKLNFLAELAPGTRLVLGSKATAAITYATSGAEFTLSGPGEFLIAQTEVKAEKGVSPKRKSIGVLRDSNVIAHVSRTAMASLRMRGVSSSPAVQDRVLEYPVETKVATLQPVYRWRAPAGSAGNTVTLSDAGGKEIWKGNGVPEGTRMPVRLSPGRHYIWTVASPSGVLGEAAFETLPAEALARAEKSGAGARTFSERVLHAMVLQDAGALQDAQDAWAALAGERPDLPELAALAR